MGRLSDLDSRVLPRSDSPAARAREAWGRKYGWSLFFLLGLAVLSVAAWAVATDRPATAGMTVGMGPAFIAVSAWLFFRHDRS